ncbi:MAG: hypothetical protein MR945_08055 [Agathobacter sp.]|nr:hypothetical protein [Agathobacter sp.]
MRKSFGIEVGQEALKEIRNSKVISDENIRKEAEECKKRLMQERERIRNR